MLALAEIIYILFIHLLAIYNPLFLCRVIGLKLIPAHTK